MNKKKWMIFGIIAGVVAVLTATVLVVFRKDIFEGGENGKDVTISVTKISLDSGTSFDSFGKIVSSSVSSTVKTGTSPWFRIEPTSIGCIYSVRVNGEEVYDYINDPSIRSITDPFTYTFTDIQKNSTIVITLDRRGTIDELKNDKTETSLIRLDNERVEDGRLKGDIMLHPLLCNGYSDVRNEILDKTSNLGQSGLFTVKNGNLAFGEISLLNNGTIFAKHGAVKIKINAYDGFELFGIKFAGEGDVEFDEITGAILSGDIHRIDTDIKYSSAGNYTEENPLAMYVASEKCIVINNYDDFVGQGTKLVLYYIPEKVTVQTYSRASIEAGNLEYTEVETRLLTLRSSSRSVTYSETDTVGNTEITTNLVYISSEASGSNIIVNVADKNSMDSILLTRNIAVKNSTDGKKVIKLIE